MTPDTSLNIKNQPQEKLRGYLEKEMRQHERAARYKSLAAQFLLWIAIISSALATLNVGLSWFTDKGVNVLAAVPAIIIYIMNTFKYEARARWHKVKARALQEFLFELDYTENVKTDELSKRVIKTLKELDTIKGELGVPSDKLSPNNAMQPTAK